MNITSISKAEKILQHQLDILWDNPEKAGIVPPLMIWGRLVLVSRLLSEIYASKTTSVSLTLDLLKENQLT